jgi:iron complex outermembrane recepter protein
MLKKTFVLLMSAMLLSFCLHAQKDTMPNLANLSLEDLMKVPIYSASKSQETSFEAPLSSSVITRDQIRKAGSTSIMEALRLCPGVIVREQTNGNYDIHIRGLDNVPPNSLLTFFANSSTLVMINNRPVYNYLHGGTFWETLPISIADVDRIEVIRGPSATLYGPNAVSGVINIITRKIEKEGLYHVSNVQYGSYNSLIANEGYGYKWDSKISSMVTGNYQRRDRTQTAYYDVAKNMYVDPIDSVTAVKNNPSIANRKERYPHPDLALSRMGINGFIDYNPKEHVNFSLTIGAQKSEAQKEFGIDPYSFSADITTATSESKYADLKATIHKFTFQLSDLYGSQAPIAGSKQWNWDYNTFDGTAEFKYDKIKHLLITPGINYRQAWYDDTKYVDEAKREGLFSGRVRSITSAGTLRIDYKLFKDKLRIVAGGRADAFNHPSKTYLSYQLAGTYLISNNHLIRAVQSRANRAPLIIDLFSNFDLVSPGVMVEVGGNENIKLLTSEMTEIGYRGKIKEALLIDLEAFRTVSKDFSDLIFESGTFGSSGLTALYDINNLTISTEQIGAILELELLAKRWHFRPYVTLQKTTLRDYSPYNNTASVPPTATNPDPITNNLYSGIGTKMKHIGTPTWYGGMYINWQPVEKLNINLNPYFWSEHTQLSSDNLTYHDGERGVQKINAKVIMNAAISYSIAKRLTGSLSFRNLLNDTSREFYKADNTSLMVFAGANFKF